MDEQTTSTNEHIVIKKNARTRCPASYSAIAFWYTMSSASYLAFRCAYNAASCTGRTFVGFIGSFAFDGVDFGIAAFAGLRCAAGDDVEYLQISDSGVWRPPLFSSAPGFYRSTVEVFTI